MANTTDGKLITVNGAHIFIKNGQSVSDAFKKSTGKALTRKSSATKTAKQIVRDYKSIKALNEKGAKKKIKAMEGVHKVVATSSPKQKKEFSTYVTSKAKLKQFVHKARFNENKNFRQDPEYKRLKSIVDKYEGKKY